MSVHNGEEFLALQIDSLIAQTYRNWRLIVRDDGSTDSSLGIIKQYCRKYPDKINLLLDNDGQLGACQGFARLIQHAAADYMMLCDQDDVWLPKKVDSSVSEILRLEKTSPGFPVLIYTDLKVVDENLTVVSDSFWRYQRIDPRNNSLNSLILDNVATGCTTIFNSRLKEIAVPIPVEAVMHDWWLALVCSVYGKLAFLNETTILYRQHGENDIGAEDFSLVSRSRRFWESPSAVFRRSRRMAARVRLQSRKLLEHTRRIPAPDPDLLTPLVCYAAETRLIRRKWSLIRYRMLSGNYIKALKKLFFS